LEEAVLVELEHIAVLELMAVIVFFSALLQLVAEEVADLTKHQR
jgi:hypothetical protein